MPTKLLPLPRAMMVRINDGCVREVAIENLDTVGFDRRIYFIEYLRKDGRANETRSCNGFVANPANPRLDYYVPFDQKREAMAGPIRSQIANLRQQIVQTEQQLLKLYTSPPAQ